VTVTYSDTLTLTPADLPRRRRRSAVDESRVPTVPAKEETGWAPTFFAQEFPANDEHTR